MTLMIEVVARIDCLYATCKSCKQTPTWNLGSSSDGWDDKNLQFSFMWLEHHANDEKVWHELVGVDKDNSHQQDSLGFLDVQS